MPAPFLCWMEKRKGAVIHSNNEGSYMVAVKPKQFLYVLFTKDVFPEVNEGTFNELKRLQGMAEKCSVPISRIHLQETQEPDAELDALLEGYSQEAKSRQSRLTGVLIQDVWPVAGYAGYLSARSTPQWGDED